MVRVLIVDDERLARTGLRRQLLAFPELEVVGEAADGDAAIRAIGEEKPDLVFLDVQMPGADAFQVIEGVGPKRMPAVVFVTAYDEHAIRAFEADAVDYLLKPVDPDRLAQSVARAVRRIQSEGSGRFAEQLETLLGRVAVAAERERRIAVEKDGRYRFVEPADLTWVEADGNYALLHTARETHRIRTTLDALVRRLGGRFVRVGRSTLVNRDAIESMEHFVKGSYILGLKGGTRIRTSRHYRRELDDLIGN